MSAVTSAAVRPRITGSVFRTAWPACLLCVVSLLPYLNKAFTIDDPTFLTEAQRTLIHPLHPTDGFDAGGTLMAYVLVPVILANASEVLAHAIQLVFALAAVFGMAALTMRLGWSCTRAAFAALLLAATPPFLPMANTAMPDVLAVALGIWGVERLAAWKQDRRWPQAIAAGLLLGLAPFARPHYQLMFPLCALFLLDSLSLREAWKDVRTSPAKWLPIGVAILVFFTVTSLTRDHGLAANIPAKNIGMMNAKRNIFAYFLYWAVPIPLALPWIARYGRRSPWLLVALPAAAALGWSFIQYDTASLWALLATAFGAAAILHILLTQWSRCDVLRVFLALWLLMPLAPVPYLHLPIKYHLAAMPAAILLLVDLADSLSPRVVRRFAALLILLGTIHSALILEADYRFTDQARSAAAQWIVPRAARGERIWYSGQWGLYWYGGRAGARLARPDLPRPQPGDLVMIGIYESGSEILDYLPRRHLEDTLRFECDCGRTMTAGAGLYSNIFGNLLWAWGHGESGRYELWRVD